MIFRRLTDKYVKEVDKAVEAKSKESNDGLMTMRGQKPKRFVVTVPHSWRGATR